MSEKEVDARKRRTSCNHMTGQFLESATDMRWLYLKLALDSSRADTFNIERKLEEFVREPIWGSLCERNDEAIQQAERYIDEPRFHCTALRDFLVVKLAEGLSRPLEVNPTRKPNAKLWLGIALSLLMASVTLWVCVNWWSGVLMLGALLAAGKRWESKYESAGGRYSRRYYEIHHTRTAIQNLVDRLKRGGFDEPTIIQQLQLIDIRTHREGVQLFNSDGKPYLLETVLPVPVPDVLYSLLRQQRRNVESELSQNVHTANKRGRDERASRWRVFVDRFLTYSEHGVS